MLRLVQKTVLRQTYQVRCFSAAKGGKEQTKSGSDTKNLSPPELEAILADTENSDFIEEFVAKAEKVKRMKFDIPKEEQEENARIGREYNRQTTILHNMLSKDLADKTWLQQDAIRAVPAQYRDHVKIIDDTPPPSNRPWPTGMSPPIANFDGNKYDTEEE